MLPENWNGIIQRSPPVGLAYIGAVLRDNNHNVKIVDLSVEEPNKINKLDGSNFKYIGANLKDLDKILRNFSPKLVGITTVTVNAVLMLKLAEEIKRFDENIKI